MSIKISILYSTNKVDGAEVDGSTVGQCLNQLVEQFPAIKEEIFDKHGKLLDHLCIFVNGKTTIPEGLTTPVKDGDELHIVPIIGGG